MSIFAPNTIEDLRSRLLDPVGIDTWDLGAITSLSELFNTTNLRSFTGTNDQSFIADWNVGHVEQPISPETCRDGTSER